MDFGLDKSAKINLKKGKITGVPDVPDLVVISVIRHLDTRETYTYQGVPQDRIQDVRSAKKSLQSG